jgi:hypothetical protein
MPDNVILLSIPGLRRADVARMPHLRGLVEAGDDSDLVPSFPCVTCPVQANMTTGQPPGRHGVVANGFFWRDKSEVEMWTAWNDCIQAPQLWDVLHEKAPGVTSAVWFALHSKGCGADFVCTPAPIHNPDGSESLWCYTRPEPLYGELRDALGHFPLHHFWGPLANIRSTEWIANSAVHSAAVSRPNFFYIYLPHLDYAAQRTGPDGEPAMAALGQLDEVLGRLAAGMKAAYVGTRLLWLVASEYTIVPVRHVLFPNRILREAGLVSVDSQADGERLDLAGSAAWTLVDHQFGHLFVKDGDPSLAEKAAALFRGKEGVAEVLIGDQRGRYDLDHARSGDVVLVSAEWSWQAYYWWLDDSRAPPFARTVDIHRKPGYDPVELFVDLPQKTIPLDAARIKGSHGAPARRPEQRGVLLTSERGVLASRSLADTDVFDLVLKQFGV